MASPNQAGLNFLQWNSRSILPKKSLLLDFIRNNNIHVVALCETWLRNSDNFYIPGFDVIRRDRLDERGGGVLLACRRDIGFKEILNTQISSCELIAAKIESGRNNLTIVSAYCPPGRRLTSECAGALRDLGSPMLICGDFNAHSQSWGCERDCSRAGIMQTILDELSLVHLNSGTHTRIAAPPFRSSAVDLTLCSASLSLDCEWRVLDDPAGSDHLPIVTSMNSFPLPILENPSTPIFDLTRHINWENFRDRVLEAIHDAPDMYTMNERYALFVHAIHSSALAAQTRIPSLNQRFNLLPAVWWDSDCEDAKNAKLLAFREFRANGILENYENYISAEKDFHKLCDRKKSESWRRYCSTINFQTRLSEVWKMAKRFRNPRNSTGGVKSCEVWMPDFVAKITPPFVPRKLELQGESSERFKWLVDSFSMSELEAALDQCSNKSPGEDGIRFSMLKALPSEAKEYLLIIFNDILKTGVIPENWQKTKVIPILKPGKDPNNADSYRPISLLSCVRKLFEKMILTRMDYWAERFEMLSATQYGFRKGRGTRDCIAILSTDIQTSFEKKEQTLCAFLDISGAYDNVLIDIFCEQMFDAQIPREMVQVFWGLFWRKEMVFHYDNKPVAESVGYKGLPQGSALSPFSYSFYTAEVDLNLPNECSLLQYADDLAVYSSGRQLNRVCRTIQTACAYLNNFFRNRGLQISETKSELVLFSRKHSNPPVNVSLNGRLLPVEPTFKYLGVVFDQKLIWSAHVKLIQQKCLKRINFMRSMAGISWGAHPDVLLIVYKGLIRSVMEYGCVAFDRMADTHLLKLERIQYKCLRIALGLMQSTHVQAVEVIAGVPPLRLRFAMLNHKFLISVKNNHNHPLLNKLTLLARLNSPKIIREFALIESQVSRLCPSVYDYPLDALIFEPAVHEEIKNQISSSNQDNLTMIAPRVVAEITSEFDPDSVIYTDGSRSDSGTGCAFFHRDNFEWSLKLCEPSGVFTAELTAIVNALHHIKTHNPGRFLIVSDSMSSIEAIKSRKISKKSHPLVLQCKEALWWLHSNGYFVTLTWAPAHVGVAGNERADTLAKEIVASDNISSMSPLTTDYIPRTRTDLINAWQERWDLSEMGRYTFSIRPSVTFEPWFKKFDANRHSISCINRLMSNHTCLRSHLDRINLADNKICPCGDNYETVDHVLWECSRYHSERRQLCSDLSSIGAVPFTPIRDMLGGQDWRSLLKCCAFFKRCNITV
jgi:ribonuclease HI